MSSVGALKGGGSIKINLDWCSSGDGDGDGGGLGRVQRGGGAQGEGRVPHCIGHHVNDSD